jgi:RecG-like helicase
VKPLLETSIEFLSGVGPERAKLLREEFGIRTYSDLLHHFPFRYVDKTQFHQINSISSDETDIQLRGRITSVRTVGGIVVSVWWPILPMEQALLNLFGSKESSGSSQSFCQISIM